MMKKIATFIVDKRVLFYIIFAVALVYCALSVGRVQVNSDITAFLPEQTQTRQGLNVMNEEFITYGSANVMVSNVTYDKAMELKAGIEEIEGVMEVSFDDTSAHYASASALFGISFEGESSEQEVVTAFENVKEYLKDYDSYTTSSIGEDYTATLAKQMVVVIVLAMIVIIAVLLFTSRSYFEVVIFLMVFGVAALLNMGTNFWLGEISAITNSIAIILQLALAIDYAIIFCHRYQDEVGNYATNREALIEALSKAIIEISSSSLTTISGLIALTLMEFGLGPDLGTVLTKGIICSLITVFLLMPGLIMLFPKQLKRTEHRNLVPNIGKWGVFLTRSRVLFAVIFIAIIPGTIYFSNKVEYAFADSTCDPIRKSESRIVQEKINNTFAEENTIAVILPKGNYENEQAILRDVAELEEISGATGLGNIQISEGMMLTDGFSARQFSELLGIDIEQSNLLFQAYGAEHEDYSPIFGDVSEYTIPGIDLFEYLFEKNDQGIVNLDDDMQKTLDELKETLQRGTDQLRGTDHVRLVFTATVPVEGKESTILINKIKNIAGEYYGKENVLVCGDITSARDLADSFNGDNRKISILTILFVFIILVFTFRSVVTAALLVACIQGSIWINFSIPYLMDTRISFIVYMIVSAIQMGATIDYAIVLTNRFNELKLTMNKKDAIAEALGQSFATIFTSGAIMTAAGFIIGYMTTDVYISTIGLALGRGTLISIILVLTALPQLLYLLSGAMDKTTIRFNKKIGKVLERKEKVQHEEITESKE